MSFFPISMQTLMSVRLVLTIVLSSVPIPRGALSVPASQDLSQIAVFQISVKVHFSVTMYQGISNIILFYTHTHTHTHIHTDINECEEMNICQQVCTNTPGSAFCSCFDGFQLQPDGLTCIGKNTASIHTLWFHFL